MFLQLRSLGGRAAPAVLCAPSGPAWTPRFRVGWEPADPAGLAEKGTRALWRCRCSWGRCSCLSLLSPFFCVPWCFHSGLTKPGASRMALGTAFPPYPEARPPCLLRSASSLRDIRAVGPPSLSVFKTVYLSGCTRSSLWQVCLVPDQGPSRAPELGAWVLASDCHSSLWDGPAGRLPSPWAAGSLQGPVVCLSGSAFRDDGFPGLSAPL